MAKKETTYLLEFDDWHSCWVADKAACIGLGQEPMGAVGIIKLRDKEPLLRGLLKLASDDGPNMPEHVSLDDAMQDILEELKEVPTGAPIKFHTNR